jgi:hypothetical protein
LRLARRHPGRQNHHDENPEENEIENIINKIENICLRWA